VTDTPGVDLDAYFERIGYKESRAADLDTLAALHFQHPTAIPFENLNPLLGRPVRLDSRSLEQKLVRDGRGGYCYEQNLLFGGVLRQLGFQVRGLAARVLFNVAEGITMPRTHMLLLVDLQGTTHLADVGFGGLTLTAPLRLEVDREQSTPHEPFRVIASGDSFVMQAKIDDVWKSLYRFDLQEQFLPDYEMANWYVSNHPSSIFVSGLMAARADRECRYALRNGDMAVHHKGGGTERRRLTSSEELLAALEGTFRVTLPDDPQLRAALDRVISRAA
jgi:N-hydroxyarylamine O-acetyltransferase